MAFERAKVSLQNVEDRLRRLFGLAGEIGATFTPNLSPAIIAGDLREAGLSSYRGRHWSYCSDPLAAVGKVANQGFVLQFQVACLVDGIFVTGIGQDSRAECHVIAPDVALPYPAPNRTAGTWIDNKMLSADAPPLLDTANAVLLGAGPWAALTRLTRCATWTTNATTGMQGTELRKLNGLYMPQGSQFVFDTSFVALQVATVQVGCYGRVF